MSTWKAYRAERAQILQEFGDKIRSLREQKPREQGRAYGQEKLADDGGCTARRSGNSSAPRPSPGCSR